MSPTRERSPRTWSSRFGFKTAGVFAMLIAIAIVVTLNAVAQPASVGAPGGSVVGKTTWNAAPALTKPGASGGISRSITVVGVGDSVTSGFNCNCESFVELYASDLASARGLNTSSVNLGVSGWTSSQLVQSMTQPGTFRDQVAKADILLVTIGANDLAPLENKQAAGCPATCYGPLVDSIGHNVALIVAAAKAAHPDHPPTILVTDYWNVFQDGDVGTAENGADFQSWSDVLTRAQSNSICTAARGSGATCVGLIGPFRGNGSKNPTTLLAADGDHPNAAGHQLIASALLANTPQPIP
jgi:lysophospholipase L1-like esterase